MIIRTTQAHVDSITSMASEAGAREMREVYGMTVAEGLRRNLNSSHEAWTILAGAEVLAIFGVAPVSVLEGRGEFWIVSSSQICRHRVAFAKACRRFLPKLLTDWRQVSCALENQQTEVVRWARWLGATIVPIDERLSLMHLGDG